MAAVGLCLVGLANSHLHFHTAGLITTTLHAIQNGPWHRIVNISGCALLLGSNYLSQKQGCVHHDHSHDGE
jgi:alkylated DNA nucleotide flippase Atl1